MNRELNKTGWRICPDSAGSRRQPRDGDLMAILSTELSDKQNHQRLLLISRSVFTALHPMDKIGALALEKVGAVIIVEESDWV